ncbi:MAG: LPS assembly protein LptD, partial [Methyloprofundus sp.]|nr:LPS assembly protein LptD [Methyloprofundus sp.]
SSLVSELSSQITDEIGFMSDMQWSHDEGALDRGNFAFNYTGSNNGIIFNTGYRYRLDRSGQDGQNQLVASTIIPIYDGWSVIGLYRYSFLHNETLEYFFGVEKDTCCWRFRVIARQFLRTSSLNDFEGVKSENSIFFQLELKGLTSIGDSLEEFLSDNIYGYTRPAY